MRLAFDSGGGENAVRMGMSDEIAKLKELHASGALTDEEFAKAKAALIESQAKAEKTPNPKPGPLKRYLLGWVVTLGLLGIIWVLNPGEGSLRLAEQRRLERHGVAGAAELAKGSTCQRMDFMLFGVGTVTHEGSAVDGSKAFGVEAQYIGALGRWWLVKEANRPARAAP